MNIVYLDLETKYLADEVGGWESIDRVRQLHEYGRTHKHIYITDGRQRRPVQVSW